MPKHSPTASASAGRAGPGRSRPAPAPAAPPALGSQDADRLRDVFRSLADLAPVAIWITEGERIVYANAACASLFGARAAHELLGRSPYALLAEGSLPLVRKGVRQALATGATAPLCERIRRLDGQERVVEIAVSALPDHGRTTVQMVIRDVTEHHEARQQGQRTEGQLRRLSARLVQAREDERRHIARELHDELGQWLTALKMELTSLALAPAPARRDLDARVAGMVDMVDEVLRTVRRIATDLRPLMLDELGLIPALQTLARDTARRTGLSIELDAASAAPAPDDDLAIALYRIAQEALTNVVRHARARRAWLRLKRQGRRIVLSVRDDGVGLADDALHAEHAHGLLGIDERVRMLGGRMHLANDPEGGASLTVELPWHARPAAAARARQA